MRASSIILLFIGLCNSAFGHSLGNEIVKAVPQRKINDKICETEQCVEYAAKILKNMDKTINPCDDFYLFACGNYIKTTKIAEHKSSETSFGKISDNIQELLRTEFEKESSKNDIKPFQLARDYYKICMNSTNIDKNSEKEFSEILERLGGWPVLKGDSWDEKSFDWTKVTPNFLKEGYWLDAFVRVDLDVDMKNNTKRIITLDQAALGLSQRYLSKGLDNPIVKAYHSYTVDLAVMFGADRKKAEKELTDAINFEIALAKISLPEEKRRNYEELYNMMRTHEISERYPDIEWVEYVNSILKPHTSLRADELVNVAVLTYLDDLNVLLKATPKRILANYVISRIVKDSVPMLSERLRDRLIQYSKVLTGSSVKPPRWEKCVSDTSNTFNHAVSGIYVRNHFSMSARKTAEKLIASLRESFRNILNEINWMDEKTKKAALEKLEYIVPHIAFPDEVLDDQKLKDYYKNLDFDSDSYLKTKLKINKFSQDKSFSKFREAINLTDWESHVSSSVVNAFYNPSENSIQFPAGILQDVFFGSERPKYTNYGGIGYVMGHEITHGFDDQGSQFDKSGNLLEWWEKETKKKYLERAQCIIDQYSNFTVESAGGLHLNGINTQGENIADNGGIKESYFAYNAWEAKNGVEPRLPGLHFTSQQMFWLSAANAWCEVRRLEAQKSQIMTDPHSPGRFRVIAPLSNMPEFSKDFNCPLGSTMNPVKKCTVW